jgi:DNA-binding NtrC family response regulator
MKKTNLNILLVDDDQYFRLGVLSIIRDFGIVTEVSSAKEALEILEHQHFDLALIDMQMEENESGITVLKKAKSKEIHSIILSSYDNDETTERAYDYGCDHFLAKLHYATNLEPYISKYIRTKKLNILENFFNQKYITQDQNIIKNISKIVEINLKDRSVFISGETGVGKSLIGKLIHEITYSKEKPFVHLNCSEIQESLLESELFGHKKGAFTGANEDRIGKLQQADGGTLFLDEIATMSVNMQKKLLKALDEKTFCPVGSNKPIKSSFTLISATCEDLFTMVSKEEFRKDLFFRISGLNLEISPLRERSKDIKKLIKYFQTIAHRRVVIKSDAIKALEAYSWPGNIRELSKTIDLLTSSKNGVIAAADLPLNILNKQVEIDNDWLTLSQKDFISQNGLKTFIKRIEKEIISDVLDRHKGKVTHAIKELKISSSAFYRIFEDLKPKI